MNNGFKAGFTPKIIFGPGQALYLCDMLREQGKKVLVITGANAHNTNLSIAASLDALNNGELIIIHEKAGHEPSPDIVDSITSRQRQSNPDVVVAIGGGSVLDTGKAVSAMLPLNGSVYDYLEGVGTLVHPGRKKPFIAVPTTAGTGSEATANAVISDIGQQGFKRSLRHEKLVPDVALVDPLLTVGCPADVTANSGMDAFTQLVESYLSVKSNPLTDTLALEGLRNIHSYLRAVADDGGNVTARSGMSYAALLSGITLMNAGLGLVHGFASSIGGMFPIPHGVVCGSLMGVANRFAIDALLRGKKLTEAHVKYATLGRLFSGSENRNSGWYMDFAASYMEEMTDVLKIKRLGNFGITENDLEAIARATDHKANPVIFSKGELIDMLRKRL
jgi:alcohol dehydrogenase class IV